MAGKAKGINLSSEAARDLLESYVRISAGSSSEDAKKLYHYGTMQMKLARHGKI